MNCRKHIVKSFERFLKNISALGSCEFFLIVIIFFLLLGDIFSSLKLYVGFIALYAIAVPLRVIFFKTRPNPKKYSNIIEKIKAGSFPSMHSARGTFLAIFVADYLNYAVGPGILMAIIAISIMYSRIYSKKHYLSDVLGGFIISSAVWIGLNLFILLIFS